MSRKEDIRQKKESRGESSMSMETWRDQAATFYARNILGVTTIQYKIEKNCLEGIDHGRMNFIAE